MTLNTEKVVWQICTLVSFPAGKRRPWSTPLPWAVLVNAQSDLGRAGNYSGWWAPQEPLSSGQPATSPTTEPRAPRQQPLPKTQAKGPAGGWRTWVGGRWRWLHTWEGEGMVGTWQQQTGTASQPWRLHGSPSGMTPRKSAVLFTSH